MRMPEAIASTLTFNLLDPSQVNLLSTTLLAHPTTPGVILGRGCKCFDHLDRKPQTRARSQASQ